MQPRDPVTAVLLAGAMLLGVATLASQAAPPKVKPSKKPASAAAPAALPPLSYNRDVRPILAENCFACHGPDSAARKAGLRLDQFAAATAKRADGGRAAIVPGDPLASEVFHRIRRPAGDPLRMPPATGHQSLSPEQIAILTRWIGEGAQYEPHWSYIPPKRPAVPKVKNAAWVRNPIDAFVLARLEKAGLQPAPEADRRTLARRVSLDLTGLPPDPKDVEAFVADKSPNAYEKLVDKYLASPHWGEHRARYWLDAARYGDTHGIHIDNYREIWSYRDWVIQAFNRNQPFDRFTLEQLAGDLLPAPTLDQKIATGFTRCNITTSEGGAIDEEYRVLYARDRTETAAQVWLGSTAGCAVCHDHKFDPLSQKEFYALSAFFNNTTQPAMDGNVKDTPPVIPVPRPEDRPRFAALQKEVANVRKQADARKAGARAEFARWMEGAEAKALAQTIPVNGLRFRAPLAEGEGTTVAATQDGQPVAATVTGEPGWGDGHVAARAFVKKSGSVVEFPAAGDFENDQQFSVSVWVKLAQNNSGGAVVARMDDKNDFRGWDVWVEGNRIATHIIHKWPEDAVKVVTNETFKPGMWHHVCVTYGGARSKESIKVYVDGALKTTSPQADTLKGTIRTAVPLKIAQRHTTAAMEGTSVADVRLYDRALQADEVGRLAQATRASYLLAKGSETLTTAEKDELYAGWLTGVDASYRALTAKIAALQEEERQIRMRGTIAHIAQEKPEPAKAYVLFRGEYDKRREEVTPDTPAALPPMPANAPKNRLGLAQWLLLPEHPLTTRVTVNRFWQEVFGQGLVATAGDFGITGEMPSHPELLDWLAVEFRKPSRKGAQPWDVKGFFKMLVMSSTYRQAAVITPEKRAKDPGNVLLSRGPRFRMDAEMVRDYALAASGRLVPKIGGPSVRPYQPDGIWEAVTMPNSDTYAYKRDSGENLYRRSLYTFWKRSAPPASLEIFNAPSREVCTVRRERTNTPLQALVTMNDVQYVEAARFLAERALKEGGKTVTAQADFMARRVLARPLRPEEAQVVLKSVADMKAHYTAHPEDAKALITVGESKPDPALAPPTLAAWTMVANQLLNLDEVLNK
jgi:Protein of unknown function (DUF1553)./Protein of unknown function (DUF1549)./Planctomycete cytochrome C.